MEYNKGDKMQFIYDEEESKIKECGEVYLLYINDELYYSGNLLNPVKLEIDRERRSILINNIVSFEEEELCCDIFKFIIAAKMILDIEGYEVSKLVSSGLLYHSVFKRKTI